MSEIICENYIIILPREDNAMQNRTTLLKLALAVSLLALVTFVGCQVDSYDTYETFETTSRGKPVSTTTQTATAPVPYSGTEGAVIDLGEEDSYIFVREYKVDLAEYVLDEDTPVVYTELENLVFFDAAGNELPNDDSVSYTYTDYDGEEQTITGPEDAVTVKIGDETYQYFTQKLMEEYITGFYAQSYGLWAGQDNDAGTVTITNDTENFYISIETNDTADLQEAHLELYVNAGDLPGKRPAPGQMTYSQQDIYADSVEFIIPIPENIELNEDGDIIKSDFYFIIHAALVEDEIGNSDGTSLAGETAYAAGNEEPSYNGKGAWFYAVQYNLTPFTESFFIEYCTPIPVNEEIFRTLTLVVGPDDEEDPEEPPVLTWGEETAYAGNSAGSGNAWWFYIGTSGEHAIYAGQHLVPGASITYNQVTGYISFNFGPNMSLQEDDEAIKIQGYDELPGIRPSSGGFSTKLAYDADLSSPIYVGSHNYLVVHFDALILQ